jgi:transcriptional regulator ATRX
MVSFVKPSLLGTLKEFKNRFVNPIKEGQHKDSTDYDVKFMKKRAHILHTTLEGCVQRKDFDVIKPYLPQKYEYALFVRLSGKQRDMYQCYLNDNGYTKSDVINRMTGKQLFNDVYVLRRICTHPWMLRIHHVEKIQKDSKRIDDFIADTESDSDDDSFCEIIDFVDNTSDGHADSDLGSDDDSEDDEMCVSTKKRMYMNFPQHKSFSHQH